MMNLFLETFFFITANNNYKYGVWCTFCVIIIRVSIFNVPFDFIDLFCIVCESEVR